MIPQDAGFTEMELSKMNKLFYVHDPMCSWCWGFEPVRKQLFDAVSDNMEIHRLVGGLAPDSMEAMPKKLQMFLQQTWRKIEQRIPGTSFNYDFWTECKPRRSTYPSNRAVIAARLQGEEFDELMTLGIQQAYYQQARNPSYNSTLIEIAADIGLSIEQFKNDLSTDIVQQMLLEEISLTRSMRMNSFPSLALESDTGLTHIKLNYTDVGNMLEQIHKI